MKLSQPALSLLEETIKQAIGKYTCGCEQTIVTDIHLQQTKVRANSAFSMMTTGNFPAPLSKNG